MLMVVQTASFKSFSHTARQSCVGVGVGVCVCVCVWCVWVVVCVCVVCVCDVHLVQIWQIGR